MIQRIQTIYLVLGALALVVLLFLDSLWTSTAVDAFGWFGPVLIGLVGITAALAVFAVFQYKHRKRQLRTVLWIQGLTVLVALVLYGGLYFTGGISLASEGGTDLSKAVALSLPVLAYVLFYLGRRGIQADIELVRSMDRLR